MKICKFGFSGESLCNNIGEDLLFWGVVGIEFSGDFLLLSRWGGIGLGGVGLGGFLLVRVG